MLVSGLGEETDIIGSLWPDTNLDRYLFLKILPTLILRAYLAPQSGGCRRRVGWDYLKQGPCGLAEDPNLPIPSLLS